MTTSVPARWVIPAICFCLAAIVWVVFGQTLGHDFVNYDDQIYVYLEPQVTKGLSFQGIVWAMTHIHTEIWHPLTTISHMLDCQMYGVQPAGHHFTNVLLHTIAVLLLFVFLRRMTGALWRSAFVAALFAIHPLRAESVAWVSERKDVLSAVFFMLTLGAYERYVRNPTVVRYLATSILFALGLVSKPMLVTLPFVLLLLDYWPFGRIIDLVTLRRVALEKIPLVILAAGSCLPLLFVQKGATTPIENLPFLSRLANASPNYLIYIWHMIWPARLTPFYFHAEDPLPLWEPIAGIILLGVITPAAFIYRRRMPYVLTGWLWYVGMLAPVVGVVQVSAQARADRYTYLPQIGLCLLLAWGACDLLARYRHHAFVLSASAIIALGALMPVAYKQVSYWRNGESLWTHALAVNHDDGLAEFSLGDFLLSHDRLTEAKPHLEKAVHMLPRFAPAYFELALALGIEGKVEPAIDEYRKVLSLGSDTVAVRYNLANALLQEGEVQEAIAQYQAALRIRPDYADAETNLANALLQNGQTDEAIAHYESALKLQPEKAIAHYNLAVAFHRQNRLTEAIAHYRKALALDPGYPDVHYNLGRALLQNGEMEEGRRHLEMRQTPQK